MQIRWNKFIDAYEFDTGQIFGTISPFGWYHGVAGLMHRCFPVDLVRPQKSFLNAEYYIRPGAGQNMLPRDLSRSRRTTHELIDDSVSLHFPSEAEFALELDLCYSIHDDAIDMTMTLKPGMQVPGFEIFFASYVSEALKETWVPLCSEDGQWEWVLLRNRDSLNSIFGIMSNVSLLDVIPTAYPNAQVDVQGQPFAEPILVARDATSGLALIFLCDPKLTKYLAGQYHGWDTAHDWSYGADLEAGRAFTVHTRMICRPFSDVDQMHQEVIELWNEFSTEFGS